MAMRMWLVGVGFAGVAAGMLGAVLLWMLATRPLAVARLFGEW